MFGVGRALCGSPSPTLLPKQGHPEQAAQDLVQAGLEYLQRRRLHNLPGQPGPGLRHPRREEVLPHVQMELPVPQFVLIAPCLLPMMGGCAGSSHGCWGAPLSPGSGWGWQQRWHLTPHTVTCQIYCLRLRKPGRVAVSGQRSAGAVLQPDHECRWMGSGFCFINLQSPHHRWRERKDTSVPNVPLFFWAQFAHITVSCTAFPGKNHTLFSECTETEQGTCTQSWRKLLKSF